MVCDNFKQTCCPGYEGTNCERGWYKNKKNNFDKDNKRLKTKLNHFISVSFILLFL